MNSFISNFKKEIPALGCIALVLVACEIGLRVMGARTSVDIRHIQTIPKIVSDLTVAPHPTVLVLGNSLTRRGVIPDIFSEALAARGFSHVHIGMIYPDDTTIADWLYLYKRYVRSKGLAPDVLLVGFAREQLSDSQVLHIDRLGGYFGGIDAASEAFRYDIQDFSDRISYLLSSVSCAYANRERVRTELFGAIIPYYERSAQTLNKAVKSYSDISRSTTPRPYKRLERFLGLLKGTPTQVVFVAIPIPTFYPVDPSLESVLRENGSQLIDLRRLPNLTEDDYLDGYHLTPHGGAIFTRELSRKVLNSNLRRTFQVTQLPRPKDELY